MKTKNTKGTETKDRIHRAAFELFTQKGYHGTSLRQISDKANIALGGIYNHFKTKDLIFEKVLANYHPWLKIPVVVKSARGNTIEELVNNASEQLILEWEKNPNSIRLHFIELIEFQGTHLIALFEDIFTRMAKIVDEELLQREELNNISATVLCRALLSLFFAYLLTDKFTGMPEGLGFDLQMFDYFKDIYLRGIVDKGDK